MQGIYIQAVQKVTYVLRTERRKIHYTEFSICENGRTQNFDQISYSYDIRYDYDTGYHDEKNGEIKVDNIQNIASVTLNTGYYRKDGSTVHKTSSTEYTCNGKTAGIYEYYCDSPDEDNNRKEFHIDENGTLDHVMANYITGSRIVLSILLLFCTPFSPAFYTLYLTAGLTDMIDGTVARKTDTVSEFGSKLDTIADIVFTVVCIIKLLPLIDIPIWIYLWIAGIAFIKIDTVLINFIRLKNLTSVHSVINKIAGAVLFIFPLCFNLIDTTLFASFLCFIATAAAIHESYSVLQHASNIKNVPYR